MEVFAENKNEIEGNKNRMKVAVIGGSGQGEMYELRRGDCQLAIVVALMK